MFPEVTKAGASSNHLQLYKSGFVFSKLALFYELQLIEDTFSSSECKAAEKGGC